MSISSFLLWPALGTAVSDHWGSIGSVLLKLLIIAALVALNGFFVACEFAIVKVRSSQLDTLEEEGHQRASLTKYIRAHLDAYLSATQLGVTLASLALGYLGEQYLAQMLQPFFALAGIHSYAVRDVDFDRTRVCWHHVSSYRFWRTRAENTSPLAILSRSLSPWPDRSAHFIFCFGLPSGCSTNLLIFFWFGFFESSE